MTLPLIDPIDCESALMALCLILAAAIVGVPLLALWEMRREEK